VGPRDPHVCRGLAAVQTRHAPERIKRLVIAADHAEFLQVEGPGPLTRSAADRDAFGFREIPDRHATKPRHVTRSPIGPRPRSRGPTRRATPDAAPTRLLLLPCGRPDQALQPTQRRSGRSRWWRHPCREHKRNIHWESSPDAAFVSFFNLVLKSVHAATLIQQNQRLDITAA
jgi:hypothetical protein